MLVRLKDIPKLPKSKFRYDNGCQYLMTPTPCSLDTATGRLLVDRDFELVGWCDSPPSELMHNRQGQIVMMFFSKPDGEMWQHYPLFDQDERDAAIIDCVLSPMIPLPMKQSKAKPVSKRPKLVTPSPKGKP